MANFTQIGLDLQSVMKRTYANLLYRSSFYNFLNEAYIGEVRTTGTPIIEVMKQNATTINQRAAAEMATAQTPALVGYNSVKVDLTQLPMDYSFRIPVLVTGSNIVNAIDEAVRLNDSQIAVKIDTFGFDKLADTITGSRTSGATAQTTGTVVAWAPATKEAYIDKLNELKATLFNLNVYDAYRLGLEAVEYGKLVSALTSVLKFETLAGVEGVDRGTIARAYGVDAFAINDTVLGQTTGETPKTIKGYFFNPMAVVGDAFFDAFVQHVSPQGWPGYFIFEGNILFGAKVVEDKAIFRLV
jgi:hypothetical protein